MQTQDHARDGRGGADSRGDRDWHLECFDRLRSVNPSKLMNGALTSFCFVAFASVTLALGRASPGAQDATEDAGDAGTQACVEVRGEVRYGALAYDHIVHLKNVCDVAFLCTVKTDVNPQPIVVTVPARQEVEVLTFRGSPARVFVPYVTCEPSP